MTTLENVFIKNNTSIKYKFRKAKQDRRHLLVVFSGFGWPNPITYYFSGKSSDDCRSNILWIKDDIENECTYYLCHKMDFSIEAAVIALIDEILSDLDLDKSKCTLMGFSKGGSAAIYFGIKYGFSNIISSCPQLNIGTYVNSSWPKTAINMMGDTIEKSVSELDELIPSLLKNDKNTNKNIYLISSPHDEQFATEIAPYLSFFYKYSNFNFVFTDSELTWHHNKVTYYNMPIIMSIIYAHGEGAYPSFGILNNGASKNGNPVSSKLKNINIEPIVELNSISLIDSKFYVKGTAFIQGVECPSYEYLEQEIIFKSDRAVYTFTLGKVINNDLSYLYYNDHFIDYKVGDFSTLKHKGIDISALEYGRYEMLIKVTSGQHQFEKPLTSNVIVSSYSFINNKVFRVCNISNNICLVVDEIGIKSNPYHFFEVKSKWLKNERLHYEGVYAVKGLEIAEWSDAEYFLLLLGDSDRYSFQLGKKHFEWLNSIFLPSCGVYQKSYFSTMKGLGVSISDLPDGEYRVFVYLMKNGVSFSEDTGDVLFISNEVPRLEVVVN